MVFLKNPIQRGQKPKSDRTFFIRKNTQNIRPQKKMSTSFRGIFQLEISDYKNRDYVDYMNMRMMNTWNKLLYSRILFSKMIHVLSQVVEKNRQVEIQVQIF
ncbi:hypothetical protein BpHYR1_006961 [Brachionus plicatilis]|uniref:Uncharacterized protein n=1 Tax=Brachionus plicatilis TaxID=10195 RepID=A0A3M7P2C6_BRAPC|nr:hypothetical protein BpHYR1_006961 [Brachionus plicatilis]